MNSSSEILHRKYRAARVLSTTLGARSDVYMRGFPRANSGRLEGPRVRNTEHVLSWCARLSTLDEWNFDGENKKVLWRCKSRNFLLLTRSLEAMNS